MEFLILTATRSNETLGMQWVEVDDAVWTIPPGRMKTGEAFSVPLSGRALEILRGLEHGKNPFVFAGRPQHPAERDVARHDDAQDEGDRRDATRV